MTIVFFGTSSYCLPVLESLNKNLPAGRQGFDLKLVVTRPDLPVGRKKILTPSATKLWAEKNNVPVAEELTFDADLAIVADYGKIIPEAVFTRPKLGTWNIHFSKLPDLRGASPVQACLLRGDTIAWVTIFKIEKTLDTGPILWQKSYPILPEDTASTLYTRLFQEVAKELPTINFSGPLMAQTGTPTFCKMLTRDDGFVEWKDIQKATSIQKPVSSISIYNRFRAMTPWPGLWTIHPNGKRMKVLKCHLEGGKLVLDQIQFEGKTPEKYR